MCCRCCGAQALSILPALNYEGGRSDDYNIISREDMTASLVVSIINNMLEKRERQIHKQHGK